MQNFLPSTEIPVALVQCPHQEQEYQAALQALEYTGAHYTGKKVLVKPNLLQATPLACASPSLVAALCQWLLDQGAHVLVCDSPGFGSPQKVARSIGLEAALAPLGLQVRSPRQVVPLHLDTGSTFGVMREALEQDAIISVARIKAHSQMLLTLGVKNLFGVVVGMRKAFIHTREGTRPEAFADALAALWAALPPSAALTGGTLAMHKTGPSKGQPYPLEVIGASCSSVALDEVLCSILGLKLRQTPLGAALERRNATGCQAAGSSFTYPLLQPASFQEKARDFLLPEQLITTSFRPLQLTRSCLRRFFLSLQR